MFRCAAGAPGGAVNAVTLCYHWGQCYSCMLGLASRYGWALSVLVSFSLSLSVIHFLHKRQDKSINVHVNVKVQVHKCDSVNRCSSITCKQVKLKLGTVSKVHASVQRSTLACYINRQHLHFVSTFFCTKNNNSLITYTTSH